MRLEEALHIAISVVTISFAFSWVYLHSGTPLAPTFEATFGIVLFTVGLGFILHELAHKYVALHYKAWAEYRAWTIGLVIAVGLALVAGFVFAAPGAVFIYGPHLNRKQNGHVAIAGAATNFALAVLFGLLAVSSTSLREFGTLGAQVNIFLGWFNTIPFFPLDGQKVWAWNRYVWGIAFLVFTAALLFFPL